MSVATNPITPATANDQREPLPVGTPESVGIPSASIEALIRDLDEAAVYMHSLIVIRHGMVVNETYWAPIDDQHVHRMYSCSKSFVAIGIGFLVDDGLVDLDRRIADYFPEKVTADTHPYTLAQTVRDLLSMRTVHRDSSYVEMADTDWVRTFFAVPPSHYPGTVFHYDTSGTVVLTALIEKITGKLLTDFLEERLFAPAGFSSSIYSLMTPLGLTDLGGNPTWREVSVNPDGVSHGGSGMMCTAMDLAKFGQFCLNGGSWNGRQLISHAYLEAATGRVVDNWDSTSAAIEDVQGYGYQIWRNRYNGFSMRGMGGQLALVYPDLDLVVSATAGNQPVLGASQYVTDAIVRHLLPRLATDELPADPAANDRLDRIAAGLHLPMPAGAASSPLQAEIDGVRYDVDENELGITDLMFSFAANQGVLSMTVAGETHEYEFGLRELHECRLPHYGYPTIGTASWSDENVLNIDMQLLGEQLGHLRMTVGFTADRLTLVLRPFAEFFLQELNGVVSAKRG